MFYLLSNTTKTVEITTRKGIFQTNLRFVLFNGTMYRVYDITSYIDKVIVKLISKNAKKRGFTTLMCFISSIFRF